MSIRLIARNPVLHHRDPVVLALPRRSFSTQKANPPATKDGSPPTTSAPKASPPNPSYPAFSFKDLGMNRPVKIVVIIALSILSVTETIFWTKVLWAKFGPAPEPESEEVGEEGET